MHVLFFMAAVVAGLINSLAGGAGLITFPLLALVVPPVVADATSALALLPAYPGAVWRTRSKLREVPRLWLWLLLVTSALGGLVGAVADLDGRSELLVPRTVVGVWRHGPTRARATALPQWRVRPPRPRPRDCAVATRGGRRVRCCHLRRLLRGRYRHIDDQCPQPAADGRRPPHRALQEPARGVP